MKKELTRLEWIAKLEEMCILLAANGEEYAHVHSVMTSETNKFLDGDNGQAIEATADVFRNGVDVYRELKEPASSLFLGIELGDTLCVLATEAVSPSMLQSRLVNGINVLNKTMEVNHIYESHKNEFGVKFKRVG